MMNWVARGMVLVLFLALATTANAGLVGVSSFTDSYYDINPATGAATFIAKSDGNVSASGLSFLSGRLYASDVFEYPGGSGGFDVVRVDLSTGASTFVSNQAGSSNWHGLASSESVGLLYSIDLDDRNILKSLAPGGPVTSIGTGTGIQGRGMAFDNVNNILYATGPGGDVQSLFTVDTTTGSSTLIGSTGVASLFIGLAYDQTTGVLYMVADPDNFGGGSANLYTLNVTTGAATLVGPTGIDAIDGLASTVPEPSTLALVGAGLVGLQVLRSRRPRK